MCKQDVTPLITVMIYIFYLVYMHFSYTGK